MDSSIVVLQPHQFKYQLLLSNLMNPLFLTSKLKLKPTTLSSSSLPFRYFCTTSQHLQNSIELIEAPKKKSGSNNGTTSKNSIQNLNESWFSSLSNGIISNKIEGNGGLEWVIGVDPDVSGALALLKYDNSGCISSQVFDSPYVQVSVGKSRRKRLDAKSIVEMLQSFNAPIGTTAYLEQSIPFPRDGKQLLGFMTHLSDAQSDVALLLEFLGYWTHLSDARSDVALLLEGWWSGGFGYGLWIGVFVASGFSVVPVPSSVWKKEFKLARSSSSKDDSRELAACLFPDLSSMLKRKKDHGRAEALLIAAYGKGLKTKADESCVSDNTYETMPKS